ncbi:sterol carrier family protein [Propionicicella superfundia]|uniref:sterol carrier family protein n=1 Tax=Propionicicella superfundia TaxID=348582 RepID=UPI0003FF4276|nr:sterol carrier family protein [Propionicicella superfundia]
MANRAADLGLLQRTIAAVRRAETAQGADWPTAREIVAETVGALRTPGARPSSLASYAAARPVNPPSDSTPAWDDLLAGLADPQTRVPSIVRGPAGSVRSSDLVRLAVCDLTAFLLSAQADPPRDALVASARTLAAIAGERYGGRTIEVRVPPVVAVQLGFGSGPVHTRGTPPNVVETDPDTFVRLGTGSLAWDDALAAGLASASGGQADLSPALPLLTPVISRPLAP